MITPIDRKSVFVLKAIQPEGHSELDGKYDQNLESGDIRSRTTQLGIFDSIKRAEENIGLAVKARADLLNRHPTWDTHYVCFELIELYLNEGIDADGNYPYFESIRTYDGSGELHGLSDLDDRCRKRFVGRDDPIKEVREGDFCWLVGHRTISPILYDKAPMTRAEVRSRFKNGYAGDFTDDSGLAFTVDSGHEHPSPLYIFPLSALPVADLTDAMKGKMLDFRERYYNGEAV